MGQDEMSDEYQFNGYNDLCYTPVPDEFFDFQMQDLSVAELRVLLYIFRRTFGFKKHQDHIALSQFTDGICKRSGEKLDDGCGLSTKSVSVGIKGLMKKGYVDTQYYCPACKRPVEPDEMTSEIRTQNGSPYTVTVVPRKCLGCDRKLYGREERWFSLMMKREERCYPVTTGVVTSEQRGLLPSNNGGCYLVTPQETVSRDSIQETVEQHHVPDGTAVVCPDCHKPLHTSEQTPKLKDVCACQGENELNAFFDGGGRESATPAETPHWTERAAERWTEWGADSPEMDRQLEAFGERGRAVQRVGYELERQFGLRPLWGDRKAVKSWMSGIATCLDEAGGNETLVIEAAKNLAEADLSIASPWSLRKKTAALAAKKRRDDKKPPQPYSDEWYERQMECDVQAEAFR